MSSNLQLQEALGQDIAKVDLIPAFVKLLKDQEAEVRTAAAHGVPDFCSNLPDDVREDTTLHMVLPCVRELVVDQNQHVRAALASKIMCLAPVLGKDKYVGRCTPCHLSGNAASVPADAGRKMARGLCEMMRLLLCMRVLAQRLRHGANAYRHEHPVCTPQHDQGAAAAVPDFAQGRVPRGQAQHHLPLGSRQQRCVHVRMRGDCRRTLPLCSCFVGIKFVEIWNALNILNHWPTHTHSLQ